MFLIIRFGIDTLLTFEIIFGLLLLLLLSRTSTQNIFYLFLIVVALTPLIRPFYILIGFDDALGPIFSTAYTAIGGYLALRIFMSSSVLIKINNNKTNVLIIIYLICIFLSLVSNLGERFSSFVIISSILQYAIVYFIIIGVVNTPIIIERIIDIKILMFVISCILFLYSFAFSIDKEYFIYFSNAAGILPILLAMKLITKNKMISLICNIGLILGIVMVSFAGSRRAFLIVGISIISFIIIERKNFKKYFLISLFSIVMLPGLLKSTYLFQRLSTTIPKIIESKGTKGMTGRERIWETGLALYRDNPYFGNGFKMSINYMSDKAYELGYNFGRLRIHNTYLKVLTETGILGLSIYLLILIFVIRNFFKARKLFLLSGHLKLAFFSTAFLSSNLGMFIASFFGWSGPNRMGWWILVAYSVVFLQIARKEIFYKNNLIV